MAENLTVYAGKNNIGKFKKRALELEAKRRKVSVSDLVWEGLEIIASPKLKKDLEKAKGML